MILNQSTVFFLYLEKFEQNIYRPFLAKNTSRYFIAREIAFGNHLFDQFL